MTDDHEQSNLTEIETDRLEELSAKPISELSDREVTSKIKLSLKRRLSYPEWLLYFEYTAPNGRRADCIGVNTMPSRNHTIRGFEFKASRSDWLREKKTGAKADYFVDLCDEWYVVAPKGVVEQHELPDGWGFLELKPNSEQLYQIVDADPTEYQSRREPDRRFWTKFMKNIVGEDSNFTKHDLKEAERRGYERGKEEQSQRRTTEDHVENKAAKWDELCEQFRAVGTHAPGRGFGDSIRDDDLRALGAAYDLVRRLDDDRVSIYDFNGILDKFEENVESEVARFRESVDTLQGALDLDYPEIDDDD